MKRHPSLLIATFAPCLFSFTVWAQSTPAELAEMSLQELFELDVTVQETALESSSPWSLSYQFNSIEFDGYRDGNNSLDLDQVLWSGPSEQRTASNFPVVPTVIKQHVHLFNLGYQLSDNLGVYLTIPHVQQETDHISIVPGYEKFLIKTKGAGDTLLSGRYQFVSSELHHWWFGFGMSFPTGSIDEQGDTPRAPGNQQLPYTMQLGSGTYDFPLELSYQHLGSHDFSLNFSAMIRTGKNNRDYRLGNHY